MSEPIPQSVLIIDDEEANRYAVGRILEKNGYTVMSAGTWREGAVYLGSKPGLIILDVQLPDANGFEICRGLKNVVETQSIPVLMTSAAFVKSRDKAHGLDSGADGYLTTPIDPLELIATVRALLRIREAEEKLREAYEKAEAANAAKTAFLANMSHEIRTPMNVIMGVAEILSRTTLTEKQKECISTLQISARSLMDLISDILDIARIEHRKVDIESVPFNIAMLMKDIMNMMAVKAAERNIKLGYDDSGLKNIGYIGDPMRLQQVIINLVSNAVKFTAQGTVTVAITESPSKIAGIHEIIVTVTDTGIGIASEKLEMIFEKFTQGDISTTRKYGGSGLGLAISKSLVEKMGGAIHVQSVPQKGSIFTITVPLRATKLEATAVETASPAEEKAKSAKKRILIVEDYPANILVTTTFLDDLGYAYETALNGNEAFEKFNRSYYDAILMDIQMQGMDGYETTRMIRDKEHAENRKRIPIIAMTAHAMSGESQKCLQAGMDDYISKPYRLAELQNKLIYHVSNKG